MLKDEIKKKKTDLKRPSAIGFIAYLEVWFWFLFKMFFYLEMHQNDIFFIFKKLILILAHRNNLKTPKNINLKQRKNI